MNTAIHVLSLVAVVAAAVVLVFAARNLTLARRFADVTTAQHRRGADYRALEAAYRSRVDPGQAKAGVAEAEKAVRKAEALLPRNRRTRAYFASKESQ